MHLANPTHATRNYQYITNFSFSLEYISHKRNMPRHILVLGSTSPSGLAFCLAALRDTHILTLYVRNAAKLPSEISSAATVIVGELSDATALENAISGGAKTCVSFLGPVPNLKRGQKPVTDGFKIIVPLLQKYGYERMMVLSTASYKVPEDRFYWVYWLMVMVVYLVFRPAYDEITGFTPLVTGTPADELGWTVFRVPILKNGEAVRVEAGYVGDVGLGLERKALAEWLLKEMEEGKFVGKCPAVSNA